MQVTFIRHGMTDGNVKRLYIGITDEPLSREGAAAAGCAGIDSGVLDVFVSPMLRARQTASILFPSAKQHVVAGFAEMDFGSFEGKSADEMVDDPAYRAWVDGGCLGRCPGGESFADFQARTCSAFEAVINDQLSLGTSELTFVVHGGTIMIIMNRYALPYAPFYDWHVDNCKGYTASVKAGGVLYGQKFALTDVKKRQ